MLASMEGKNPSEIYVLEEVLPFLRPRASCSKGGWSYPLNSEFSTFVKLYKDGETSVLANGLNVTAFNL